MQLREKHLEARPLLARARLAAEVCRDHGVPFVLNDRPDLALEMGADGVHVGQDDAPPALARRILGAGAIVGLSTHAPAELDASAAEPVDYLSAGPVEPTPTKPGRPAAGLDLVRSTAAAAPDRPWFAIGGIDHDRLDEVLTAGADRVVVVRAITEADDPGAAAAAFARRLRSR